MAMSEIEWTNKFAENLEHALEDRRMTQRELAVAAELSESIISEYIKKKKMPGVRSIINIADALDMTIDELIDFGERIG